MKPSAASATLSLPEAPPEQLQRRARDYVLALIASGRK